MKSVIKKILIIILFLSNHNYAETTSALKRTITFQNYCSYPVWIALTPTYIAGNNKFCRSNSDCLRNASCLNNRCVYPIPLPRGGQVGSPWKLQAFDPFNFDNSQTQAQVEVSLQYSIPNFNLPYRGRYQYIANIRARTGCSFVKRDKDKRVLVCETGECLVDRNNGCISETTYPSTQAKLVLNHNKVDFYDLSFIHGINVPIGIQPADNPPPAEPSIHQNPLFWCGRLGFADARSIFFNSQFNAPNWFGCNWQFNPPSLPVYQGYSSEVFYTVVKYNVPIRSCFSSNDCLEEERCGFSHYDLHKNRDAVPHCGRPIAFTVLANICAATYDQGAILPKKALGCYSEPGNIDAFRMQAYALCALPPNAPPTLTAPSNCYAKGNNLPNPDCCGCINWSTRVPLEMNSFCQVGDVVARQPNFWQIYIRPKLEWLTEFCPIGYLYPHDQVHARFKCASVREPDENSPNFLNYVVTFCPDKQNLFGLSNDKL
ncbi:thaumatin family protein [Legionella sp. D16C41]|uniref:thaumatin family protein n=1 Tax=Legionella sp. D16C41 TaxID=3402688 RepID=UPI003AF93561